MKRRIGTGVLMAIAVSVLAIGGTANAGQQKAKTNLTIDVDDVGQPNADTFFGDVKSPRVSCRERKVKLFSGTGLADTVVSDTDGEWHIEIDNPHGPGPFTAKVRATDQCQRAVSKDINAD